MADTLTIGCPECGKQFKVPATAVGKKVRCKTCGEIIPVSGGSAGGDPAAAGKKAGKAAPHASGDLDDDGKPYGLTDTVLGARCPECAYDMKEGDVICLKCGYNTQTRIRAGFKKTVDITGLDIFLWLLPAILCALVVIGLLVWDILYLVKGDDWFSKDGDFFFLRWGFLKLWSIIISLFVMFFGGKFAIKRLIYEPKPPEVEIKG